MVYQCKKCNCVFDLNILYGENKEVEYLTCPQCAGGAYTITDEVEMDFTCICCNKTIKTSLETYNKIQGKPCLSCRSILAKE